MSHQRGYQGGPPRDYGDNFGQGGHGKRQWRGQQPQGFGQGSGQTSDPYYGAHHFPSEPSGRQSQGYHYPAEAGEYQDPHYYQGQDDRYQSSWGYPEEYQGDQGEYYPTQRQYHQQHDYYQKDKYQAYKQYQKQPKKGFSKPKRYPADQGGYNKSYGAGLQMQEMPGEFEEEMEEDDSGVAQPKYPQASRHGGSFEDTQKSGRKGSSIHEQPVTHQQQIGGQGATKPAYGEYYTQKKYEELERLKQSKEKEQTGKNQPTETGGPADSQSVLQPSPSPQSLGVVQLASASSQKMEGGSEPGKPTKETLAGTSAVQTEIQDERFSKTMAKFNTLDRGTYFVRDDNKSANFMVVKRSDLLGWKDTYVINGYLLHGVILKLLTLTSRIFLFIENLHPIYKKYIRIDEDGETARWTDEMPDTVQIVTLKNIEKVEVLDNDEDGFEGFVCYTVCEDSSLVFEHAPEDVEDWKYVQDLILLYEPTSIRKIYLDVVYNAIYKPESKGFGGKRIAAIVNPNVPGETIQYSKQIVNALGHNCVVGTIWIQNGRYTLIAETVEDMERLIRLVDMALDIAEELSAYVMITNLRRTFDYVGKTILYINSDPTLKLIKSNNPINFANKIKKSDNLI